MDQTNPDHPTNLHPLDDDKLEKMALNQLDIAITALSSYYDIMSVRCGDGDPLYPDEGYAAGHLAWEIQQLNQSHVRRSDPDEDYCGCPIVEAAIERSQDDEILEMKQRDLQE